MSDVFDEHGRPLDELYDVEALARAAGLSTRMVLRFVVLGLIDPMPDPMAGSGPGPMPGPEPARADAGRRVRGLDPESVSGAWRAARFRADTLTRIARIQRLRRDLAINLAGVGVVLELLERVEGLERELAARRRGR